MPVEGLPSTLESMMNAVLNEMSVSSFKIESRGAQAVVVIRLTPSSLPPHATQNSSGAYRRKCPSQVNRDKRRAEEHRANRELKQASESSPSALFLPTPPSLFYTAEEENERSASGPNSDMFTSAPFTCSVPASPSPSDRQDKVNIDMPQCDDTQSVTVCCDTMGSVELGGGEICESDEAVEEASMFDSECAESVEECAVGMEHAGERECVESQEMNLASEVTYSDLMKCLQEFDKQTNKKMDELLHTLKGFSKTGSERNLGSDVS